MGTRSTIALLRNDGTVAQIYCHWDGYLEHNGQILNDYYNTYEKVEELIALGNLSMLERDIGVQHPFGPDFNVAGDCNTWEKKYGQMCVAYHRDRGEDLVINEFASLDDYEQSGHSVFQEYNYVFMHGTWTYCTYDGPARLLEDGLKEVNKEAA